MNKFFALTVLAVVCAGASAARIPRDAPADAANPLAEMFAGFESVATKLHTGFLDLVGVKDNAALLNMVETNSKTFADKLQEVAGKVAVTAKDVPAQFEGPLNSLKAKIDEMTKDLQAKNPELTADTKKYQEQFEANLKSMVAETNKFTQSFQSENKEVIDKLEKVAKELYEATASTASTYAKQVEKTLKEQA